MADDSYYRGRTYGQLDGTWAGAVGYNKFMEEQAAAREQSYAPVQASSTPAATTLDFGYAPDPGLPAEVIEARARRDRWLDRLNLILALSSTLIVAWIAYRLSAGRAHLLVDRYDFGNFTAIHARLIVAAGVAVLWASMAFRRGLIFNTLLIGFIGWYCFGR